MECTIAVVYMKDKHTSTPRDMVQKKLNVLCASALALGVALGLTPTVRGQHVPPYEPKLNQPGKDVQWVPTPPALVEKMLDMAQITPDDRLVDLGSGDGVVVIAAARRGARARGIEYDRGLVAFSRQNAKAAGVSA